MRGTLINAAAIILGGILGLLFKKGINKSMENSIHKAMGIAVLIIGINGIISNMFTVGQGGVLKSSGEIMLVVSLALGTLIGEILKLEEKTNSISEKIEKKFNIKGFSEGFITAGAVFCIGAMSIIGSLNDGISGDSSVLITKSLIDFTAAIILSASLGVGVVFSFIPVLLYQGLISLLAGSMESFLAGELLLQICMIGYSLIMCIGINFIAKTKIKTVNMLPAILIPVFYSIFNRILILF